MRCADALDYVTVESSDAQRAAHPAGVTALASMPDAVDVGVVFANELLDNLPFDVLSLVEGRGWREVRVGHDGVGLSEVLVETDRGPLLGGGTAHEIRIPIQAAAADWVAAARRTLDRGRVVVIDYAVPGYPAAPGRDWLRTYSDHGHAGDPLDRPGTKDITVDIDIAQLRAVAATDAERSQAIWLRRMGIDDLVAEGQAYWEEHRAAPDLQAFEMQSRGTEAAALLDPAGLGGFTVLEWAVGES